MSGPDDAAEKEHDPTQKRLDVARAKGEIARSPDVTMAAVYAGFLLACTGAGAVMIRGLGETGMVLLDQADRLAPVLAAGGAAPVAGLLGRIGWAVAPLFALPALAALAVLVAQRGLIFTGEKLAPKLARLSPVATAKQKFGREGLFEFAKGTVKMGCVAAAAAWFLGQRSDDIIATLHLTPALATAVLVRLSLDFLGLILLIAVVIAVADHLWQRAQHLRRNRMSRQDMLEEMKSSEGDPHVKALRRQRGVEIATNRMMLDVPKADVVIVNPTHFAVALRWTRGSGAAPVCVAKGVDAVAARMRAAAAAAGVPLHSDPATARALHAAVDIGQQIRPEHYRAVAAAIRFAETMRRKARARR